MGKEAQFAAVQLEGDAATRNFALDNCLRQRLRPFGRYDICIRVCTTKWLRWLHEEESSFFFFLLPPRFARDNCLCYTDEAERIEPDFT
jgi:hypothetical protein